MIKLLWFSVFYFCLQLTVPAQTVQNERYKKVVDSLINLSKSKVQSTHFDEAARILNLTEDLILANSGKETADYASVLNLRGVINYFEADYQEAEKYYYEAMEIRRRVLGRNHVDFAKSLDNLALLYSKTGEYEKSEIYHTRAKDIREKTPGKNSADYASTLNNMAILYKNMGTYDKAEALYIESKDILERTVGRMSIDYADCLNNLANLNYEMGRYDKSEALHKESMDIKSVVLGKNSPGYASSLSNLANLYIAMRKNDQAELLCLESVRIWEQMEKRPLDYASSLNTLANLYSNVKMYEKAEPLYLKAMDIRKTALGENHPEFASSLNNLANMYTDVKQYEKAERLFRESRQIRENTLGKTHASYANSLQNLANLYAITGQYSQTEQLIDSTVQIVHDLLAQAAQFSSEKDLGFYQSKENKKLSYIPSYLQSGKFSGKMACIAYDDALFQKGFLQSVARRSNLMTSSAPEADSLLRLLRSLRFQLSKEYVKPISERKRVSELEYKANSLESTITRLVSGYIQVLPHVRWEEVQASLRPDEAAIEFLRFQILFPDVTDSIIYAALIIRPGFNAPKYVPLCDENTLDAMLLKDGARKQEYVEQLYKALSRGIVVGGQKKSTSLYQLLWKPLEESLQGVNTVYYSNTGLLHRINLGAIPFALDTTLSDRYKLVQLGSTRSVVLPSNTLAVNSNSVVMGGIEYDSDSSAIWKSVQSLDTLLFASRGETQFYKPDSVNTYIEYWSNLPYTNLEANNVADVLKKYRYSVKKLSGYQATEEAFHSMNAKGGSPRVLHIATHGFFLPDPKGSGAESQNNVYKQSDNPLIRSGIILAGGNHAWATGEPVKPGLEDGILTAYEISQINLSNTELVVLSACETGLGDIQGNEGVYGLQRALKIAGVKYLVMSLWQVPDKQTAEFMKRFYQNWLEKGMTIPDAFRLTQHEMRERFVDPYGWAGLVLIE